LVKQAFDALDVLRPSAARYTLEAVARFVLDRGE
jgi:hypothetical protein